MGDINSFALQQAEVAATRLWAFGSAPCPLAGGAVRTRFVLNEPFRTWPPADGLIKVNVLRNALNRIIHATDFKVGFERLPGDASRIVGGAIGVIYLSTRTDQRDEALIDVSRWLRVSFTKSHPN